MIEFPRTRDGTSKRSRNAQWLTGLGRSNDPTAHSAIRKKEMQVVAIQSRCLLLAFSLVALFSVSACGPSGGTIGNPQVRGDHSTISGDSAATADRKAQ